MYVGEISKHGFDGFLFQRVQIYTRLLVLLENKLQLIFCYGRK